MLVRFLHSYWLIEIFKLANLILNKYFEMKRKDLFFELDANFSTYIFKIDLDLFK